MSFDILIFFPHFLRFAPFFLCYILHISMSLSNSMSFRFYSLLYFFCHIHSEIVMVERAGIGGVLCVCICTSLPNSCLCCSNNLNWSLYRSISLMPSSISTAPGPSLKKRCTNIDSWMFAHERVFTIHKHKNTHIHISTFTYGGDHYKSIVANPQKISSTANTYNW